MSFPDTPPQEHDSVLSEALHLVAGPRQAIYGSPLENWARTARIASAILGKNLTAQECVAVLVATKLARLQQTPNHRDSLVDLAGYAHVWAEVEGV